MNIKNTPKFRLLIVISIIWIYLVFSSGPSKPLSLLVVTSPIWVFWASVWIWSSKFENFFDVGKEAQDKKALNEWVYWDTDKAKKHKLYGIKGWALLLAITLVLPIIIYIALGIYPFEIFGQADELMAKEYSGYKELSIAMNIQTWVFTGFSLIVFYLLITHKESFQRFYVILFFISLVSDIFSLIATAGVLKLEENDVLLIVLHTFKYYIVGLAWLFYVLKSKRINLTTRKRIRKKYENVIQNAAKKEE